MTQPRYENPVRHHEPVRWRRPRYSALALCAVVCGCGSAEDEGAVSSGAPPFVDPQGPSSAGPSQQPSGEPVPAAGSNGSGETQPVPTLQEGTGTEPGGSGAAEGTGGEMVTPPLDPDQPRFLPEVPPVLQRGQGPALVASSTELLPLTYTFYGAQRSGDGANWLLDAGETCHMADGQVIGQDLTGGWYDAGDHLKVTLSISEAAYVVSKAFDAFPALFVDNDGERSEGVANGVPDVLDETKYAADYLVKAHIATDQLVAMIGEVNSDHAVPLRGGRCSSQAAQNAPRPVSMQSNADISGITTAALALISRLYRPFDTALADTYLQHAREIYEIARANPRASNPGLYGQTQYENAWVDEAMCGAAELYRATGEAQYRDEALRLDELLGPHGWAPNFSQAADFCRHSLIVALREAGELEAAQPVAANLQADVQNYMAKVSTEANVQGMVYMDQWGSLRYATGAGFGASLYYELTGDGAARDLALSQLNFVMGQNPQNRSFVIGFGNNPPENPHHRNQIATGRSLVGALVGGPSTEGYVDSADDFRANEVALDYNAGLVGLAAFGAVESAN